MYKIFNACIEISSNSYKYYITNNFEQLIKKKSLKIIFIIITPILTTIDMHIRLTEFLKADVPKIMFDIDKKVLKKLVIIKKICAKLIFDKCVSLN